MLSSLKRKCNFKRKGGYATPHPLSYLPSPFHKQGTYSLLEAQKKTTLNMRAALRQEPVSPTGMSPSML
jgi:hypothetical protein